MRESTNFPGDYTLCVCFEARVEHYRIILQVGEVVVVVVEVVVVVVGWSWRWWS